MKTLLCLFVVAAAAALSYWHVPAQRLLHLAEQAFSPARPKSVEEAPTPTAVASVQTVVAAPVQAPTAAPSVAAPARIVPATTAPAPTSAKPKAELAGQVAQAQQAAVAKYPALAVAGSEINSRFVFRYKTLLAQQSPRLLDPTWPMQLADECAAASAVKTKTVATR